MFQEENLGTCRTLVLPSCVCNEGVPAVLRKVYRSRNQGCELIRVVGMMSGSGSVCLGKG